MDQRLPLLSEDQILSLAKVLSFFVMKVVYYFQDGPLVRRRFPFGLPSSDSVHQPFKDQAIRREALDEIIKLHFDAPCQKYPALGIQLYITIERRCLADSLETS